MIGIWIALAAAVILVVPALLFGFARRLLGREQHVAQAVITDIHDTTTIEQHTGAVRSVQTANLYLPESDLEQIWTPLHLERLARTYWRFLTRATLGLIRVKYTEDERWVVLLFPPLRLLSFHAPEYEMDEQRGVVRWRIARGVLVARAGHDGDGYLQIDVRRCRSEDPERARLHVEVEVANFYPAIAAGIGRWLYNETQSRIHVIVTYGFLRSLARLDLAQSRVGRFARIDPAPPSEEESREEETLPVGR
jgi:hypothetical protein